MQAYNFTTSNVHTRAVSTDALNLDAANFIFKDNSVNILTIDRVGTTATSLTANSS